MHPDGGVIEEVCKGVDLPTGSVAGVDAIWAAHGSSIRRIELTGGAPD